MIREILTDGSNPFLHRIEYCLDDMAIGYLEYSIIYDRMEIDNILVLEKYRHMGIGSMLMDYIIDIYEKEKLNNITLEVRKSNANAINLYRKYGFIEVGVRKYYYGDEDGILMEKR